MVYSEAISIANRSFHVIYLEDLDIAVLLGGEPGEYVMRFYRDSTLLAEGDFSFEK